MGLALVVVVLHVVHAGKLGLADHGKTLGSLVLLGYTGGEGKNVRLSVLFN